MHRRRSQRGRCQATTLPFTSHLSGNKALAFPCWWEVAGTFRGHRLAFKWDYGVWSASGTGLEDWEVDHLMGWFLDQLSLAYPHLPSSSPTWPPKRRMARRVPRSSRTMGLDPALGILQLAARIAQETFGETVVSSEMYWVPRTTPRTRYFDEMSRRPIPGAPLSS
jgi:hypothetical protein